MPSDLLKNFFLEKPYKKETKNKLKKVVQNTLLQNYLLA